MNVNFTKRTVAALTLAMMTASLTCSAFADITVIKSLDSPEYAETIVINENGIQVMKSHNTANDEINKIKDRIKSIKDNILKNVNNPNYNAGNNVNEDNTETNTIYSEYVEKVIELTNIERTKYNLQPLKLSDSLCKSAQEHADDMYTNNYFSHVSQDGRTMSDRIEKYTSSYGYKGENIASGYSTPEEVVKGWMSSEGHRANLLNKNYTDIGVGYNNGYWVQNFGG